MAKWDPYRREVDDEQWCRLCKRWHDAAEDCPLEDGQEDQRDPYGDNASED